MNKKIACFLLAAAAAFGQTYEIAIQPGGMASDVVVTDMANYQHQDVWNLRLNKRGEWAAVPGYVEVEGVGLDRLKNAIEIYDDLAKDRFLVLYMADSLSRLEYPYNSIYTKPQKITIPAGVTIDSSKDVYFNWHNGVLRISGATSEPVWYSYVQRNLFTTAAPNGVVSADWFCYKAALADTLDIDMEPFDETALQHTDSRSLGMLVQQTEAKSCKLLYFTIYDNGQYTLCSANELHTCNSEYVEATSTNWLDIWWQVCLKINHTPAAWPSRRITGAGIVVQNNEGTMHIVQFLDFSAASLDSVSYSRYAKVENTSTLALSYNEGKDYVNLNDGYFYQGEKVTLSTTAGMVEDAVVDSIVFVPTDEDDRKMIVYFDRTLAALSQADYGWVRITHKRNWVYDGSGWVTAVAVDLTNEAVEYYDFTGIPAGTTDISCNYKMMEIIEGKSYAASQEARETGWVRYSPLYQYDVFPTLNIIQTKGSDLDEDITIVNRDGRLVIMNKHTIEQGSVANQYATDVAFRGNGLYAPKGYLLNENILYVMDQEDLYQFDGNVFRPFMTNTEMRNFYRERIDTTGFLGWDKLNREMVVVLNDTTTIVYQADYNSWYRRTTDLNGLLFGFLDHDSRLLLGDDEEIVTWNHSNATYGEELDWGFTTKVTRASDFGDISQLLYLYLYIRSTDSVAVTIEDDNETRVYTTQYMPATIMSNKMLRPRYWFEEAEVTVENVPDPQNEGSAIIRKAVATIWK